jgi:hypothetical protein
MYKLTKFYNLFKYVSFAVWATILKGERMCACHRQTNRKRRRYNASRKTTFSACPTRDCSFMTPGGTFGSIEKVLQTWKSLNNHKSGTEFTNNGQ